MVCPWLHHLLNIYIVSPVDAVKCDTRRIVFKERWFASVEQGCTKFTTHFAGFCGFCNFPVHFRHISGISSLLNRHFFRRKHWLRLFQTFWVVWGHNASICWEVIIFCSKRGLVNVYSLTFSFLLSTPLASQSLAKVLDDFWMFEVELVYKWKLLLDSVKNRLSEGVLTTGLPNII